MSDTKTLYRLNWERIFGDKKPRGYYYPLPSEAATTIVQILPDFKISCLFRPKTRPFVVDYKADIASREAGKIFHREINTPTLLMSHLLRRTQEYEYDLSYFLGDPDPKTKDGKKALESKEHHPACYCQYCAKKDYRSHRIKNQFYLFAVDDSQENSIWAQPYRLNNVYEDGRCCFKKPHSTMPMPQNMRQAHNTFWMDRFDNDFNIGPIPHKCLKRAHTYRYCLARRPYHQCDLYGHHSHPCDHGEECDCCRYECDCGSNCDCCNGECDCKNPLDTRPCDCRCCMNTCGCRCSCDLGADFADKLASYEPEPGKYLNYTKFLCGKKFISVPRRANGVFFSVDSELLADIPPRFHNSSPKFNQKFIVGFVRECHQGISIDLRSDFVFTLSSGQYTTVQ